MADNQTNRLSELLRNYNGEGAATTNLNMLAQGLRSRNKEPMNKLKPFSLQDFLDMSALATSPVPVVGDVVGLGADAYRFGTDPSSRTPLNFGLAALGLIPFVPPLVSAGLGKFAQSQGKSLAQAPTGPARNQAGAIVYHGSPHKFDQFDSSKIGTGEGAQAYGHGLYFAENPKVAQEYKKMYEKSAPSKAAITKLRDNAPVNSAEWKHYDSLINEGMGSLYKVDLPDEAIAKMLDWDKPLSQQSPEVQKAVSDGMKKYKWPQSTVDDVLKNANGQQALNYLMPSGNRSQASDTLRDFGAPGIRYLDGGSRGAGEGTRNFVVFPGNEGLLKILDRQ